MKTPSSSKLSAYNRFSGSAQNANHSSISSNKIARYQDIDGDRFDRLEEKFKAMVVKSRLTTDDGKKIRAFARIRRLRAVRRSAKNPMNDDSLEAESQGWLDYWLGGGIPTKHGVGALRDNKHSAKKDETEDVESQGFFDCTIRCIIIAPVIGSKWCFR
jgi:hypothetical protein